MSQGIVETHIERLAEQYLAKRRERLDAIDSEDAARERQEEVRAVCAEILGEMPERTPLQTKVIQRLERDGYELEALMYESWPGQLVTANLYLPTHREPPYPSVLCNVGHWEDGKAHSDHQRLARLLARRGIATLIIDAVGQGERVQLYDVTLRRSWLGSNVALEHTHLGNLFYLIGRNPATLSLWDALRGVDLLSDREELDSERIAAVGDYSGATLTRYLCLMEKRLTAAACVLSEAHFDPLGGLDAEQNLFGALPRSVTPIDGFMAFAPKPLLLCHVAADPEPEWAAKNTEELGAWYDHFYARPKVEWFSGEGQNGYFRAARAQTVDFLARAFGLPNVLVRETQVPIDTPQDLFCTETGQICNSLNIQDWFGHLQSLMAENGLPPSFEVPDSEPEALELQASSRRKIRKLLELPKVEDPVEGQVEGRSMDWGLTVEKGRLIVEEGIYLPYSFYSEPDSQEDREPRPTVLTVHERGLAAVAAQGPWMTRLATGGFNVMAVDVRGTGETRFVQRQRKAEGYEGLLLGTEASWARRSLNAGINLFGRRVFDVLRAVSYLRTRRDVKPEQVCVTGVGRGALWALYAAALDAEIAQTVLLRGLTDYKCLAEHRRHNHHFSLYLPGVVKDFDLPLVAACVAPRPLTLLNPVQQRRERRPESEVREIYRGVSEMYSRLGSTDAFSVVAKDTAVDTIRTLADALGTATEETGNWDEWQG